jgi:serine/threonine-protein kinase
MSDSDPITRLNAALEGRYRIESELGEGGMATVYLADDIKHEGKVALKVLKPELAAVVGAERFLAEIKTTANLTHPPWGWTRGSRMQTMSNRIHTRANRTRVR